MMSDRKIQGRHLQINRSQKKFKKDFPQSLSIDSNSSSKKLSRKSNKKNGYIFNVIKISPEEQKINRSIRYKKRSSDSINKPQDSQHQNSFLRLLKCQTQESYINKNIKSRINNHNLLSPNNITSKLAVNKSFDNERSNRSFLLDKSKNMDKKQDYYLYWKKKAHQFLENNMKMMQDINKLTKENDSLKRQIQKSQRIQVPALKKEQKIDFYSNTNFLQEIRNMNSIYISKIEDMEKVLKKRDNMISLLELRISELNLLVNGDRERIKLISKMEEEIILLQEQNFTMKYGVKERSGSNGRSMGYFQSKIAFR